MRKEMTHTYDAPLKKGFDYIDDFKLWPDWYVGMTSIIDPETGKWSLPGDEVRFVYKLLGRRLEGVAILEEYKQFELVAFRTEVPGLPVVHFRYEYAETTPERFEVRAVLETDEPATFFGKAIDKALLPTILARDLKRSLENLEDIFASGVLD